MSDKITGVCVDIPMVILRAKNERRADYLIELLKSAAPGHVTYTRPANWISVKDRMPAPGEYVLTYSYEHEAGYVVAYYGSSSGMFFYETDGATSSISATHWMPLPAPPK